MGLAYVAVIFGVILGSVNLILLGAILGICGFVTELISEGECK